MLVLWGVNKAMALSMVLKVNCCERGCHQLPSCHSDRATQFIVVRFPSPLFRQSQCRGTALSDPSLLRIELKIKVCHWLWEQRINSGLMMITKAVNPQSVHFTTEPILAASMSVITGSFEDQHYT